MKRGCLEPSRTSKWKPPPEDIYKINTDGAYDQKSRKGGWGFVIGDNHGDVLVSGAGNIKYAASALHAEAMAVNKGILYASQMGMTCIILEMDNTVLAYAPKGSEIDGSAVGCLVHKLVTQCASNFLILMSPFVTDAAISELTV